MKYFVGVLEYHRQYVVIEAESKEEALTKVEKGEGTYLGETSWESTTSRKDWTIYTEETAPDKIIAKTYFLD